MNHKCYHSLVASKQLEKIIREALAMEVEGAKEAGTLGYMARAMVQATMPHRKLEGGIHRRTNGDYTFVMMSDPEIGLPYGSVPRLVLAWLATEAVKTKSRELVLGDTMSAFMWELGLIPSGGRWGTITSLKEQSRRLFGAVIQCSYSTKDQDALQNYLIADSANLWWTPKAPDQQSLFNSQVTLSDNFYREITDHPVPIDMRAMRSLKRSPLALDIYCWLTYRMSYLGKPTSIPWEGLQTQFGSDYPTDPQGIRNFKRAFLRQLKKVSVVYPEAKVSSVLSGLLLKPSRTHIAKK